VTVASEPVGGPSHDSNHEIEMMISQLHHYSSQQLQPTKVCLPASVQHLAYEDDDIIDVSDDGDDSNGDGARTDVSGPQTVSVNCAASTSAVFSDSTPVCSL